MRTQNAIIDLHGSQSQNISMVGMNDFGNLIRMARERKGLDQRRFAELIGRDSSFVSRLETGMMKNTPDARTVRDVARVLGVSPLLMLEELGYLEQSNDASEPEIILSGFSVLVCA